MALSSEEQLEDCCQCFTGCALVVFDSVLVDNASTYYLFDSNNKIVRVGKAVSCGIEVLKYIADDEFVKRYSSIFELGDVFEWTHSHKFYVWMDSIIASRLKLYNLYSSTMQPSTSVVEHVSCYSLFPLQYEAPEYSVNVLLLLLHSTLMWFGFSSHFSQIAVAKARAPGQERVGKFGLKGSSGIVTNSEGFVIGWIGKIYLMGLLVVEIWGQFLHPVLLGNRLPFLPLMVVSIYCALGMMYYWIWQLRRIIIKQ